MLSFLSIKKSKITLHICIILVFTVFYHISATFYGNEIEKKEFNNIEKSLYYSLVTHSTVGYGHTETYSLLLKRVNMLHIAIIIFLYTSV